MTLIRYSVNPHPRPPYTNIKPKYKPEYEENSATFS